MTLTINADFHYQPPDDWEADWHGEDCETLEAETLSCGCIICPDPQCERYLICRGCQIADAAGY